MLLAAATAAIAGFAIFLFKNRRKQFWISFLGFLLSIGLIALFFHYTKNFQTGGISISSLVMVGAIIAFFFAMKGIRKDQKLIRDLNRLR
jgi:branched-subunit amino acid transport protein AzlD